MNPIELYKRLPRKNCGQCGPKTCMPFAISVLRGDVDIADCPHLAEKDREELRGSITQSDWREDLIVKLRAEVSGLSFPSIAEGIGAGLDKGSLIIRCLGREFRIGPDGAIETAGPITPWMKILLLHYVRTAGKGDFAGKWVSFSELKAGMVKASAFQQECEDPMKALFDRDFSRTGEILQGFGAQRQEGFPTEQAYLLFLLPKIPVVILFWQEEEDFPSRVKIVFDSSADKFLDVETMIFLVEGLVHAAESRFDLDKK
ncbi:MAG: DUF3786 domain-containing protein [Nitrospirales bacterium]|nr:DUF3786 domain-containing protein [Nitrospirales bacterium]